MLTLANMRVLVALVEEASFTRAAERLGATQSGVSQQIAKLERALAVALVDRATGGVVRRRQGDLAGGDADLAAARVIDKNIDAVMAGIGIRP